MTGLGSGTALERAAIPHLARRLGLGLFLLHGLRSDAAVPGRLFCGCGDPACAKPGKHPRARGWQDSAVFELDDLLRLVTDAPGCNIGIVTGGAHGVVVVDVDPRNGGLDALDEFEMNRDGGPLPATFTVATPNDGLHLYFRLPEGTEAVTSSNVLGPGIDVRGYGGLAVFVGSVGANGKYYEATVLPETGIAPVPEDVLTMVRRDPRPSPAPGAGGAVRFTGPAEPLASATDALLRCLDAVALARPGTRNDVLNRQAFTLGIWCATGRLDPVEVIYGLWGAAKTAGLNEREAVSTARSGLVGGVRAASGHEDPVLRDAEAQTFGQAYDRLAGNHD
jgi:hypothetical protein